MTDTTPEYIAMCGCPEVQGRWNVTAFDLCYSRRDGVKLLMPEAIALALELDDSVERIRADHIYLPDQRAIQEWCLPSTCMQYYSDLIQDLYVWTERQKTLLIPNICGQSCSETNGTGALNRKYKSPEQLWLAYFMDTVHELTWKNGKWISK